MADINIIKRDGSEEALDLEKLHKMVQFSCDGLTNVSASLVEMNSGIQFYDGMSSDDIQEILVRSASDLITLDTPNYQYVASRLLLSGIRKRVYGVFEPSSLFDTIHNNIALNVYDDAILTKYTDAEITLIDTFVKHDRDYDFVYAGLRQMVDKYLVQDRLTGDIYETPQTAYILIAMTLFAEYPSETRMKYIKEYYDAISQFKISLPTPLMAGVRTPTRQFSSCVLLNTGDTIDSIFNTNTAIGKYTSKRAGIGLNMGRVRAINSKIRGGEVVHTGQIPFLKMMAATVRSCSQNGIRGGNATINYPIWHMEIEDIIQLKNNKGSDDNRVRTLDYCIHMNKLFYQRALDNKKITLFSPHEVIPLYDAFYSKDYDGFVSLYEKYEKKRGITKKRVNAKDLLIELVQQRFETGRIYILNADNVNVQSPFSVPVEMTNLCCEILLPTEPIHEINDNSGEIALCTLSAINVGRLNSNDLSEVQHIADLAVRALDALIDYQDYPIKSAETSTIKRRNLGVGVIGYAHYLAKNKVKYDSQDAFKLTHELFECIQYNLMKASCNLAKEIEPETQFDENGQCSKFYETEYANGRLPIDTYNKNVDSIISHEYKMDWETLRSDIALHGMRNSVVSSLMPSESSSVVSGETNGIEPPRAFLNIKSSKRGNIKLIVPGYPNLKNNYDLLWEQKSTRGYLSNVAIMQKFIDQGISANTSYNPENYTDNKIPMKTLIGDLLFAHKHGIKTLYYCNTYDLQKEDAVDTTEVCDSCTI